MTQTFRRSFVLTLSAAAFGLAATATPAFAGEYYVPAAAPITYKMANPNMMMGYAPQTPASAQPFGLPQVSGPALGFDQTQVDPTLYAHQRVGQPYTVAGQTYYPAHEPMYDMVGTASWYGDKYHGKLTASGDVYDKNAMTAAHKTLPLGSYVMVTNMATGQSLKLLINDRGPFIGSRIIDLSEAAATVLGYKTSGLGDVRVQYAGPAAPSQQAYTAPAPQAMPQYAAPLLAPAPTPTPAPQQMAQAWPQQSAPHMQALPSMPQGYQPLRDLAQQFAPATPHQNAPAPSVPGYNVPNIMAPAPDMPQAALPQATLPHAPIAIPQAHAENSAGSDDEFVTLTIKGPIHMANHRTATPQPRFIQAVNRTSYKTK